MKSQGFFQTLKTLWKNVMGVQSLSTIATLASRQKNAEQPGAEAPGARQLCVY